VRDALASLRERLKDGVREFGLARWIIVAFLVAIWLIGAIFTTLDLGTLLGDCLVRAGMNGLLVLALVLPVRAGNGLNFGIPLGIVCGLMGGILVMELTAEHPFGIASLGPMDGLARGASGFFLANLVALPLAALAGWGFGWLLEHVRGKEMMVGIYVGFGSIAGMCIVWLELPLTSSEIILPIGGEGVRQTIKLDDHYKWVLDGAGEIHFGEWREEQLDAEGNPPPFTRPEGFYLPTGLLLYWLGACALEPDPLHRDPRAAHAEDGDDPLDDARGGRDPRLLAVVRLLSVLQGPALDGVPDGGRAAPRRRLAPSRDRLSRDRGDAALPVAAHHVAAGGERPRAELEVPGGAREPAGDRAARDPERSDPLRPLPGGREVAMRGRPLSGRPLRDAGRFLARNAVPVLFLVVCVAGIVAGDLSLSRLSRDVLARVARNLFLVLSLVIPIVAGLGLNFGIVLGAMAGQTGLMIAQNGEVPGFGGILVAVACSVPVAIVLGWLTGLLFNRTKGREMITGIILGFFANGIYQFVFLILAGPVIPLRHEDVLLPQGMGLRVTINLTAVERAIDDFDLLGRWNYPIEVGGRFWGEIPVLTLLLSVLLCLSIVWLFRTKLGQDLRAVGQDPHVAEVSGINVARCRILAVILSMVLAGIGQIIWLQNMAVMNTFQSHEQVGFYAIAALLVGGATVTRVTIWNAIAGTILFHTLIVVVSVAGPLIIPKAQIGEYLREFVTFAIIGATLAIHAWRSRASGLQ